MPRKTERVVRIFELSFFIGAMVGFGAGAGAGAIFSGSGIGWMLWRLSKEVGEMIGDSSWMPVPEGTPFASIGTPPGVVFGGSAGLLALSGFCVIGAPSGVVCVMVFVSGEKVGAVECVSA